MRVCGLSLDIGFNTVQNVKLGVASKVVPHHELFEYWQGQGASQLRKPFLTEIRAIGRTNRNVLDGADQARVTPLFAELRVAAIPERRLPRDVRGAIVEVGQGSGVGHAGKHALHLIGPVHTLLARRLAIVGSICL